MGMKKDLEARANAMRKDSAVLQDALARVHQWIFQEGTSPKSKHVKESKVGSLSMVPVRVCCCHCFFGSVL